MDLGDLAKTLNTYAKQMEDGVVEAMKKTAVTISQGVVTSTPVDTGLARSSWRLEFNQPATGIGVPISPSGSKTRADRESIGVQATAYATQDIYFQISQFSKNDESINITNNVHYMYDLDELGTSKQAPKHFVRRAIERGIDELNKLGVIK